AAAAGHAAGPPTPRRQAGVLHPRRSTHRRAVCSGPRARPGTGHAVTTTCTACELHAESTFKIEGMDCREEVALIERRFRNLPGLEDFSADLVGQRLHVKYDAAIVSASAIAGAVADAGMRAWLEHEEPLSTGEGRARQRQILIGLSAAALVVGLAAQWLRGPGDVSILFFIASLAASVPLTIRRAWHALRLRALDINVLML